MLPSALRVTHILSFLTVAATAAAAVSAAPRATPTDHDDAYLYRLPYDDGESFPVLQAYGSRFSHRGPEYYTIDFRMAEGTPVLSAREGVVTAVDATHSSRCWDDGCGRLANHVVVRHDDGTYGMYFHLAPDSVDVVPGQRVRRGQRLAQSGNTGLTTTPHLHFGVYVFVRGSGMQSIPVRFETSGGPIELRQGRLYSHPTPAEALVSVATLRPEPRGADPLL